MFLDGWMRVVGIGRVVFNLSSREFSDLPITQLVWFVWILVLSRWIEAHSNEHMLKPLSHPKNLEP